MGIARILVVEDDESTSKSLGLIFRKNGYQVDSVSSGSKALQMAAQESYNLAIVDIRLPDTNGTELLAPLKGFQPDISVIVVTGYASLETSVQALNAGADAYIIKPINVDLVLSTIKHVLEKQELAAEKLRAERALRESEKRLKVLHELDYAILSLQSPKEMAQAGLEHLAQLVNYKLGFIILFDGESDDAHVIAIYPREMGRHSLGEFIRMDPEWIEKIETGLVLSIEYLEKYHKQVKIIDEFISRGIASIIAAPLIAQDVLMGSLILGSEEKSSFSEQSIQIVCEVARPMAIAIRQANLMNQILKGRERLQRLSKQLLDVQEAERRTLALELHDQIGQTLTAIKIRLQTLRKMKEPSLMIEHLDTCIVTVDQTLQDVRTLALNLRPSMLDDLGLEAALRWLVDRQTQSAGLMAEFSFETGKSRPEPEIETVCFRVAQEAITNVLRHAQATEIRISLKQDDNSLILVVSDNGKGFDVPVTLDAVASGESLGLLGMYERVEIIGGSLDIVSRIGEGTRYTAQFPFCTTKSLDRHMNGGMK